MTRRPDEPSLFQAAGRRLAAERAGLAERLRPERLDDLLGQRALLGEGTPLRQQVRQQRLRSLLLWGPPGCGKTTLARVLAQEAGYDLVALSAVSAGVADVRAAIEGAEQRLAGQRRPTLLFVDEIHRFHKGQQDALLHAVEDGRLLLIGATTEHPSFHVNAALLSRLTVLRLQPLDDASARALLLRALTDEARGLGARKLVLADDALAELVSNAGGDARRLLNDLERAADRAEASGRQGIETADVVAARGERVLSHDRAGERHYDLLSALHKSLRGSDPDAAAYWVQRLLLAGEDPVVVARRLVRMASEDIGLADPRALRIALDSLEAVRFLGMPEGDAALVAAAIFLALAPKSDAVYRACLAARLAVERHGELDVPAALRHAPTALHRRDGAGRGYRNPHEVPGGLTGQQHLPDALRGSPLYEPGERGAEAELGRRLGLVRASRGDGPSPATNAQPAAASSPESPAKPARPSERPAARPRVPPQAAPASAAPDAAPAAPASGSAPARDSDG